MPETGTVKSLIAFFGNRASGQNAPQNAPQAASPGRLRNWGVARQTPAPTGKKRKQHPPIAPGSKQGAKNPRFGKVKAQNNPLPKTEEIWNLEGDKFAQAVKVKLLEAVKKNKLAENEIETEEFVKFVDETHLFGIIIRNNADAHSIEFSQYDDLCKEHPKLYDDAITLYQGEMVNKVLEKPWLMKKIKEQLKELAKNNQFTEDKSNDLWLTTARDAFEDFDERLNYEDFDERLNYKYNKFLGIFQELAVKRGYLDREEYGFNRRDLGIPAHDGSC